MAASKEVLKEERKTVYRIVSCLNEENLLVLERYAAFLRHIQDIEEEEDVREAKASMMEPGENIPWEKAKEIINRRHGLQD